MCLALYAGQNIQMVLNRTSSHVQAPKRKADTLCSLKFQGKVTSVEQAVQFKVLPRSTSEVTYTLFLFSLSLSLSY